MEKRIFTAENFFYEEAPEGAIESAEGELEYEGLASPLLPDGDYLGRCTCHPTREPDYVRVSGGEFFQVRQYSAIPGA